MRVVQKRVYTLVGVREVSSRHSPASGQEKFGTIAHTTLKTHIIKSNLYVCLYACFGAVVGYLSHSLEVMCNDIFTECVYGQQFF